jgi:hypothetical protein
MNGDKIMFVVEDVEVEETTFLIDLNARNHWFFEYYNVLTISFNFILFFVYFQVSNMFL